jgi:hypothetical protein
LAYWLAAESVGAAEAEGSVSTVKSTYPFHKYADLYRLANEEELSRLTDDIKKNGLANPIVLFENKILDGRNRYIACTSAGVEPRFNYWEGERLLLDSHNKSHGVTEEHATLLWVVSQNSHRRHLSTSQLAMVAAKVAEIFQEDAKKRQRAGKADPAAILQQGRSSEQAAKTVGGVSERSVADAIKVQKASPELAAKVLKGDITVAQAKKELPPAPPKESNPKPQKVKKVLPPSPTPIPDDIAIPNSKTMEVLDKLEKQLNESYDVALYFASRSIFSSVPHQEGVSIHSVAEYKRLEQIVHIASKVENKLSDVKYQTPEKDRIDAMLEIRDKELCDPKWKIGDKVGVTIHHDGQRDMFKELLEPFGWHKTMGHNFIKERTFATKDDPQPNPPTPSKQKAGKAGAL